MGNSDFISLGVTQMFGKTAANALESLDDAILKRKLDAIALAAEVDAVLMKVK